MRLSWKGAVMADDDSVFNLRVTLSPCDQNCCWAVLLEGTYQGYSNGLYVEGEPGQYQFKSIETARRLGEKALKDCDFMDRVRMLLLEGYHKVKFRYDVAH